MQPGINRHRMRAGVVALAIAATAGTFAGCKRGEAGDAKAESAPAPTTVGTENVVVVTQAELASGPAISGNLQAAQARHSSNNNPSSFRGRVRPPAFPEPDSHSKGAPLQCNQESIVTECGLARSLWRSPLPP